MRLTGIFKPSDYPGTPEDIAPLFDALFPGNPDPAFDEHHAGMAIAAHHPKLALQLGQIGRTLILETGWTDHATLRELAIATLNTHFGSTYSLRSRGKAAEAAGVSDAMIAALPDWRTSPLFDDEQRLVIEYTYAVVTGIVPAPLFARVREAFGERATVELTSIIGLWSFWAMMLNAARPDGED